MSRPSARLAAVALATAAFATGFVAPPDARAQDAGMQDGGMQDDGACDAIGDTLASARAAYADACASIPRRDCDPIVGGWACASYRIGAYAPPHASNGPAPAPPPGIGECRWIDASLDSARVGFEAMCRTAPNDCDPVPEGWMCSSRRIGLYGPGGTVTPVSPSTPVDAPGPTPAPMPEPTPDPIPEEAPDLGPEPTPDPGPEPGFDPGVDPGLDPDPGLVFTPPPAPRAASARTATAMPVSMYDGRHGEPTVSWADSYSANGVCYAATNGDHGVHELRVDTPRGRMSVREALALIASGPGISRADALYNDVRCGRGPANDRGDEDADQCPGRVDVGRAGCALTGPDWRFVR